MSRSKRYLLASGQRFKFQKHVHAQQRQPIHEAGSRHPGKLLSCTLWEAAMNLVKLGKKGQVTIPRAVLREVGIEDEAPLCVEAGKDGSIVLRRVGVYPLETYTPARIEEFEALDSMASGEAAAVQRALAKRKKKK
jgi:bifunctional DNA-binding transcriptional regulator/antitoxin component of YhaV-PrlF toxin-antitoxin module